MEVYPLIFEPIFKPRLWGGRRLAERLHKHPPDGERIGESWEIAHLEDNESVVRNGPARGRKLGELLQTWGQDLVGRAPLVEGRFPLLLKFLDAREALSVQVHPAPSEVRVRAGQGDQGGGAPRGKHEAWYVVEADPGGCIYRGLEDGVDERAMREAIAGGSIESLLRRVPVKKGQGFYLPGGTLHALGGGVLVAEVQTPSDVTYRVYDWQRTDPSTGAPRALHVAEALECLSFDRRLFPEEHPEHVASVWTAVTSLIRCGSFVVERVRMIDGLEQPIPYEEMVIWMVLEGRGEIRCPGLGEPASFAVGDSVLLPAALRGAVVKTHSECMWLEVSVPVRSSLAEHSRPDARTLREAGPGSAGGLVPLGVPVPPRKRINDTQG